MAVEVSRPTSGETVTVVCRLPSGIVLDLYDDRELSARAESKAPVMSAPVPKATIRLRGARRDPRYHPKENIMLGMGGRTEVAKDLWDAWCKQNPNFGPMNNGLIFAAAQERRALDMLAERANDRTGFEGCTEEQLKRAGVEKRSDDD